MIYKSGNIYLKEVNVQHVGMFYLKALFVKKKKKEHAFMLLIFF